MKIKILVSFVGNVEGKSVYFKEGQVAEVNPNDADNFIRGHYAELVKPAVKILEKPEIKKSVKILKDSK